MIKKIISGGQSGVERAALDLAIKLDIPHGGWITRGRLTQDGVLPDTYKLNELPSASHSEQIAKNVMQADGTVIFTRGWPPDLKRTIIDLVETLKHPYLIVDLDQSRSLKAATQLAAWIQEQGIEILHVTGSRTSRDPGSYQDAINLLEGIVYLSLIRRRPAGFIRTPKSRYKVSANDAPPQTVNEAVNRLADQLSLRDKITLANMTAEELVSLQKTLGRHIREKFGLFTGNQELMHSCRFVSKKDVATESEASAVIIERLWNQLKKTHKLRVIK
ncbi:MAG: putative molybdenum carrier protein [Desulfobacterales bacterium]|jgi:hypothetical protein